jgi:hypothetical protein
VKYTYLLTPSRRNIVDQFKDRLDRISELSEDELKAFREELLTEFNSVDDGEYNSEKVEAMKFLSNTFKATKAEQARRVQEASTLAAEAAEAAAAMKEDDEEEDEEEEVTELASDEPAEAAAEEATEELETPASVDTPGDEEEIVVTDEEVETPSAETEVAETEAEEAETEEPAEEPAEEEEAEESTEDETKNASEASAEDVSETPTNTVAELATEEINPESSEEPVTASSTPATPEDRRPSAKEAAPLYTITAGADVPNLPMGSKLPNLRAVAQALVERKKAWGNIGGNGDGEKSTVAKFTTSYPEDRILSETDLKGNRVKVEAVVASAMKRDETGALIAAGGLAAPVNMRYELFGFSESTDRPVRDSLLVFNADRGGIRYITPPILDDVEGAVSLWTIEDDEAAAVEGATTPVKPCLRVKAGSEVNVYIEAIPLCLTFGNLVSRTYPELVERHTELAMVWHARYAEVRLLTRIGALSTSVSAPSELGAARDIFNQVDQAAAAYRSRHRLDSKAPLRVIFPEWFKNALRVDLTKQLPGDGQDVTFNLADADINRWFASRQINVTWHIDGETTQIFGAQEAGDLLAFPANVIWYLFAEGTFLFLDGGELDLGLVRDSTLNGTNDYKIFLETFEGVAKVGIEALRVTSALALTGASSGTVDLVTPEPTV